MHRLILTLPAALAPAPAFAAGDVFFSLRNTDFVVLLAFLVFIGILVYFKVPGLLMGMLDKRAQTIQGELDEARALREEAQTLLASYERKHKDVQEQAERIVTQAKKEATAAAEQGKLEIERSIERRLKAAQDQIASAEDKAVKEVRDRAIGVATEAARQVVGQQMTQTSVSASIDAAIDEVGRKLH